MSNENTVSKYAQAYKGYNQLIVEVVEYKEVNKAGLYDALIKFSGPEAEKAHIDGMVFKYNAEKSGSGYNFKTGNDEVKASLSVRKNSNAGGHNSVEAYINNSTFTLVLDDDLSKAVLPLHLLSELKK